MSDDNSRLTLLPLHLPLAAFSFSISVERLLQERIARIKCGALNLRDGVWQIQSVQSGGVLKDTDGAGDRQSLLTGDTTRLAVVEQNRKSSQFFGLGDGLALPLRQA
jgi:hypothetical protein